MRKRLKHIVLTDDYLNQTGILKTLNGKELHWGDFTVSKELIYGADDVVYISDSYHIHSLKCRYRQYNHQTEKKGYESYINQNLVPLWLDSIQLKFLSQLLRLHSSNIIELDTSDFYLIVITLFRKWYSPADSTREQLNTIRTKYKSSINENKFKGNITKTLV